MSTLLLAFALSGPLPLPVSRELEVCMSCLACSEQEAEDLLEACLTCEACTEAPGDE